MQMSNDKTVSNYVPYLPLFLQNSAVQAHTSCRNTSINYTSPVSRAITSLCVSDSLLSIHVSLLPLSYITTYISPSDTFHRYTCDSTTFFSDHRAELPISNTNTQLSAVGEAIDFDPFDHSAIPFLPTLFFVVQSYCSY